MKQLRTYITAPVSIAPLTSFRVLFGLVMAVSVVRFWANGWIDELYLRPTFFFRYYGFEWVEPLGAAGMYAVFGVMVVSALGIALGAAYRVSAWSFFLGWTYVELLDVTNYLNHYYFVSIAALLLAVAPAHRDFSVDAWLRPAIAARQVPRWAVGMLRLQMGIVYFYAGVAKLNSDWLLRAMPLKLWLASRSHYPLIGWMFKTSWGAYAFSWLGCAFDLLVPFGLLVKRIRPFAYLALLGFHLITWWLFPIGMFPFIMMLGTLVFFPASWHEAMQGRLRGWLQETFAFAPRPETATPKTWLPRWSRLWLAALALHFLLQIVLPWRYLLYPRDLFWHEQGYRFSWRVMLMEKAGYATFTVRDPETGRSTEVRNLDHLQPNQERMMSTQPDLILQFAQYLDATYRAQGIADPEVYADVHATLNGSGSRPLIDPHVDLSRVREGFAPKDWVLPFDQHPPFAQAQE